MRLGKKEEYYKPNTKKATALAVVLTVLSILIFCGFSLLSMKASDKRMLSREMATDLLCTTETPCFITITVKSDKEPVNLQVTSPSGTVIHERDMEEISSQNGGLSKTLSFYSEESGDWLLSYDRRMNNSIGFSVKQEYTEMISIQDAALEQGKNTGAYYLKFTPVYKDGSDTKTQLSCSVTMETLPTAEKAKMVYNGTITMNRTARVQLDTENLDNGKYKISVLAKIPGDQDSIGQTSIQGEITIPESVSGNAIHAETGNDDGGDANGES